MASAKTPRRGVCQDGKPGHLELATDPHAEFFHLWEKHARQTAGAPNPFIDPNELPTFVAASAAQFETELARQQAKARS